MRVVYFLYVNYFEIQIKLFELLQKASLNTGDGAAYAAVIRLMRLACRAYAEHLATTTTIDENVESKL